MAVWNGRIAVWKGSLYSLGDGSQVANIDIGYNGRCNVLGPGRYADLGRLNNEISSLRRIR